MTPACDSPALRLCLFSRRWLRKLFILLDACLVGFWLGVLKRETLYGLDEGYYSAQAMYCDEAYNCQGLWPWERAVIDRYFQSRQRLLVTSVGGGREVLALRRLGYTVDGFECHPRFVACANRLLQKAGYAPDVELAPRDQCPPGAKIYDGLIVGWGAYMLIQGRGRRIAFLKKLRLRVKAGAPVLLSFFHRTGTSRRFKVIVGVGNALRSMLGRDRLCLGDDLRPNYVHHCSREEIMAELQQSGFELVFYATESYGHAVGIACAPATTFENE